MPQDYLRTTINAVIAEPCVMLMESIEVVLTKGNMAFVVGISGDGE